MGLNYWNISSNAISRHLAERYVTRPITSVVSIVAPESQWVFNSYQVAIDSK